MNEHARFSGERPFSGVQFQTSTAEEVWIEKEKFRSLWFDQADPVIGRGGPVSHSRHRNQRQKLNN